MDLAIYFSHDFAEKTFKSVHDFAHPPDYQHTWANSIPLTATLFIAWILVLSQGEHTVEPVLKGPWNERPPSVIRSHGENVLW